MFECRVEPKHDLNLSVRWYRNDEELVGFIMIIYNNNIIITYNDNIIINLSVCWYRNDEELVGLIDNDEYTKDERINTSTGSAKITKRIGRP